MLVNKPTRRFGYLILTAALFLASCSPGNPPAPTADVNAISTTIIGTTIAQFSIAFTQTALAMPTSTPASTQTTAPQPTQALPTSAEASPTAVTLPTFSFSTAQVAGVTPQATAGGPTVVAPVLGYDCNKAKLVAENPPDGTVIAAGTGFSKVWQVQNIGSCTWSEGYVFTFLPAKSSAKIKGYNIAIKRVDEFTKPNSSQSFIVNLTAPTKPGEYMGVWQMQDANGTFFGPFFTFKIVVN